MAKRSLPPTTVSTPPPPADKATIVAACPFCSNDDPSEICVGLRSEGATSFSVMCHGCGTEGPQESSKTEAVARWNSRPANGHVLNDLCDETQHRVGIVEGALDAVSDILWDNAGEAMDSARVTQLGCMVDLARAELSRIGEHLDPGARPRPTPQDLQEGSR